MQECNPPRNSWPQTHQDDGIGSGAEDGFVSRQQPGAHRIDRFADALKNSQRMLPFFTAVRGGSRMLCLLWFR